MAIVQPADQDYSTKRYSSVSSNMIEEVKERISPHFTRSEPRRRFIAYLSGLLSGVERKNGSSLAEYAQEVTPDGMQRLLTTAKWDAGAIRDELHKYINERFGDPQSVVVVTQAAFTKRGRHSAGVKKQFNEDSQRVENCQIGMFVGYVTPRSTILMDRELYVPEEWRDDRTRRSRAGIPEIAFASRTALATRMLARVISSELPMAWVTTSGLAHDGMTLHEWLWAQHVPHIVEVPPSAAVRYKRGSRLVQASVADLLGQGTTARWQRFHPWDPLWSRVLIRSDASGQNAMWLVASAARPGQPRQQYLAAGPVTTTLAELAGVAKTRARSKEALDRAKVRVGLDDYETRRYVAWYRHVTLALFAEALLQAHVRPRGDIECDLTRTATTRAIGERGVREICLHHQRPAGTSLARWPSLAAPAAGLALLPPAYSDDAAQRSA
jgi:SRSO17 transposase